ncbi:J domain-containing protein [Treponema sp. TIM-1]|uniref:J domain-containing protein n=1 Tax=Treponema sp. TIM-1 TaxID=2898417 RepID=UPI003980D226
MGFFDRIETIIKSYLNDEDDHVFGRHAERPWQSSRDPDLDAAFEELNDFLSGGGGNKKTGFGPDEGYDRAERFGAARAPGVPEVLAQDFAELGLSPGASAEECKAAYKQLLKKHHPDRHAGHPGNLKKATEKSTRLNAAYDRIERWRRTGRVE